MSVFAQLRAWIRVWGREREGDKEPDLEKHERSSSHSRKEEVTGHRQHQKEVSDSCSSKVAGEKKERKKIGLKSDRTVEEVRRRSLDGETPWRPIGDSSEVSNGASVDLGLEEELGIWVRDRGRGSETARG